MKVNVTALLYLLAMLFAMVIGYVLAEMFWFFKLGLREEGESFFGACNCLSTWENNNVVVLRFKYAAFSAACV